MGDTEGVMVAVWKVVSFVLRLTIDQNMDLEVGEREGKIWASLAQSRFL